MDEIALGDHKVDKLTREGKKRLDLNHALVGGEKGEIERWGTTWEAILGCES
jgi:hypothetical protein